MINFILKVWLRLAGKRLHFDDFRVRPAGVKPGGEI